jgi:predicted dehydrogenase
MDAPIRTLLVGIGTRGKHWTRLVHEEPLTAPVGYVDPDERALAWARDTYGAHPDDCYETLDQALQATQPELVVLATPPMGHVEEARAVFAAGADLLAEKPLTLDFAGSLAIVRAAEEAGRRLMVGLNFRYLPTTLAAKRLIAEEIGQPSFARFIYWLNRDGRRPGINKYPLTMRQPMLYEQSIHHLDLFRFTYDAEVERVWCRCHNPPWSMYADDATVAAMLEMTGGLLVNYFGTWSGQTKAQEFLWRTDCANGALLQYEQFADLRVVRPGSDVQTPIDLPPIENFVDDTRAMLADIARQLLAGVERPHPSGVDHLKTMALTVACDESNVTGKPVEMAEFYARHGWEPGDE